MMVYFEEEYYYFAVVLMTNLLHHYLCCLELGLYFAAQADEELAEVSASVRCLYHWFICWSICW